MIIDDNMYHINLRRKSYINYGFDFRRDLFILFNKTELAGKRVLLITGINSFRKTRYYKLLKGVLAESKLILAKEIKVDQNPTWDLLDKFRDTQYNFDVILCVGGGSVIDFGKALKLFFYKNTKIFAIYTLPGSASIITPFVIFDNHEFKIGEHSENIVPDYVYINREILLNVPTNLIKLATFDILAHTVESFVSNAATNQSKRYALKALGFLTGYIDSGSTDVFSLIKADIFAGLSEQIGLVLFPHAAGHYLTYRYKIPHSLATMYFLEKFIICLQSGGLVVPQEMLRLTKILNTTFLKEFKKPLPLTNEDVQRTFDLAEKYMPFIFTNNPVPLDKGDYLTLYNEYENYK